MDTQLQTLADKVVETSPQFCAALTRDEIEKFVAFARFKDVPSEEILYEVGSISDEFYLIVGGEVILYRDELGDEIEVGRLGAGQLTGHMSFFDREPRTVYGRCAHCLSARTTVHRIPADSDPVLRGTVPAIFGIATGARFVDRP